MGDPLLSVIIDYRSDFQHVTYIRYHRDHVLYPSLDTFILTIFVADRVDSAYSTRSHGSRSSGTCRDISTAECYESVKYSPVRIYQPRRLRGIYADCLAIDPLCIWCLGYYWPYIEYAFHRYTYPSLLHIKTAKDFMISAECL